MAVRTAFALNTNNGWKNMNNLGEYLKKEREKKGITLEDASKVTRVRKAYLQSIEEGNFDLQSPVFIRGFLKSYADYLGLNSNEIIEKYNETLTEKKEGQPAAKNGFELEDVESRKRYLLPLALSLALVILIFILTTIKKPDTTPTEVQKAEEVNVSQQKPVMANTTTPGTPLGGITLQGTSTTSPTVPTSPVPKETTVQAAPTPDKKEKRNSLVASAREITWLQITIDDNDPVEALLQAGETASWSADSKISILVGNAGGVDLTFNGKPVESLGPSGKVVSRTFPQ